MDVFYFCNGKDPDCSHEDCHITGGNCCHTTDRAFARETQGVRLFEEYDPDTIMEIDPEELQEKKPLPFWKRLFCGVK